LFINHKINMIERRVYSPDMSKRKPFVGAEEMRTNKLKRRRFRVAREEESSMKGDKQLFDDLKSKEIKAGKFLRGLIRFLGDEATEDFVGYIKNRDLQKIKILIYTIGKHFPIYNQALEMLSEEFFRDPNKIDWEEIDNNFLDLLNTIEVDS